MNKAIFVTVRTASTRLPGKALLEINGTPVIGHIIDRIKRSKQADGIVLCTTELEEDDVLVDIATKRGLKVFRGSVNDKLERWRGAAEENDVEIFVTSDGDDVFCEPELIDLAFKQYENGKPDFIEGKGIICGSFTYAIKRSALEKVCEIKDTEETEMMWVFFTETGLFKTEELKNVPDIFKRPEIRMTLDYEADFQFFNKIFDHFKGKKQYFDLRNIVEFLDANPDIIKINQHLQETYLANQKENTKLSLKKDAM